MRRIHLFLLEKFILILVIIILAIGFILFLTNYKTFLLYVQEDGIVEWLTVAGLLAGCFTSVGRLIKLFRRRNWWFLLVTFLLALMLFFAAGEEISWGQRIFGIKSSEFFAKNNAQGETNLHNLVVDGVKLNKLIFSVLLSIGMAAYLLLVPLLHQKSAKIRAFLDHSGVPVARVYQILSFVLLFIIVSLIRDGKNAELLECGAALLFFLIIRFPKNKEVFDPAHRL